MFGSAPGQGAASAAPAADELDALLASRPARELLAGAERGPVIAAAFERVRRCLEAEPGLAAHTAWTLTDRRQAEHWELVVDGGRARVKPGPASDPQVEFQVRAEQLVQLALGRTGGAEMISRGLIGLGGDAALGRRVASAIAASHDQHHDTVAAGGPRLVRPLREASLMGASALLNLLIMFLASLGMWLGVPVLWLFLGSRLQASSGSLGLAVVVMAAGASLSVGLLIWVLHWLGLRQQAMRRARGLGSSGEGLMEMVVALSAVIALGAFAIWFLLFAGGGAAPPTVGH
ncbi:MAG: hypothetical protein NVSMB51_17370 [Solirubrobacteraceae bacterium]